MSGEERESLMHGSVRATAVESWFVRAVFAILWFTPFGFAFLTDRALYYRDHSLFFRPAWWSIREQVMSGQIPVLNLAHPSGVVHEVSTNQALLTPTSLLLFLGPFERTYDLFVLAHIPVLATGVYVLARRVGWAPAPSVIVGLVCALAGPVFAFENLLVGLQGLAYTPWLLWSIKRTRDEADWTSVGLVGLSFSCAAQAIMPEVLLLDAIAVATLLLGKGPRPVTPRVLVLLMLGGTLGLLGASFDLLPLFDALRGTSRMAGFEPELRSFWALTRLQWLEFLVPSLWSTPELSCINVPVATGSTHGPQYLTSLYLGVAVPLAAAAVGQSRATRLLALGGVFFLAVAMGDATPLHGLVSKLPLLRNSRFPVKYVLLTVPVVSILCVTALLKASSLLDRLLLFASAHLVLALILVTALSSEAFSTWLSGEARPYSDGVPFEFFRDGDVVGLLLERMQPRLWHAVIMSGALVGVLVALKRRGTSMAVVSLGTLLLVDLGTATRFALATASVEAEKLAPELRAHLSVSPARVVGSSLPPIPALDGVSLFESYVRTRGAFGDLSWSVYREYTALDLEAMGVNPVQAIIKAGLPKLSSEEVLRVWRRIGAARYLSDRAETDRELASAETIAGRRLRVYEISAPRPYLAAYPSWRPQSRTSSAAISGLAAPSALDEAVVWVLGVPPPDRHVAACVPRLLDLPQSISHDVEFVADSPCSHLVVLQELRLPRWRASIDGVAATVIDAEAGYVAVRVPSGRHRVRLYYDSLMVRYLPLSIGSILVCLLLVAVPSLRRDRRTPPRAVGSTLLAGALILAPFDLPVHAAESMTPRLGLHLGAPTGLSAAFDLGPAFGTHLILVPPSDATELGARLDLLYRLPELGDELAGLGRASFWVGAGLRWTHDAEARSHLGVRVPFGLSLFSPGEGHELYAEIAPALTLHPDRRALVEAGLGLRLAVF